MPRRPLLGLKVEPHEGLPATMHFALSIGGSDQLHSLRSIIISTDLLIFASISSRCIEISAFLSSAA
jgi:hypothetical protein